MYGHKDKVKVIPGTNSQRVIVTSNDNKVFLGSNKNMLLSTEDEVIPAETFQTLDCVQSNHYLLAQITTMENSNRCFLIQRSLNLTNRETKIKYVIQFGIVSFVKEQMIRDFKLQPFSFQFDEVTINQVQKQC